MIFPWLPRFFKFHDFSMHGTFLGIFQVFDDFQSLWEPWYTCRKISIRGPCSNRGPFPSLDAKNADFQANFPKCWASNKSPPTNIEKNWSYVMLKHLKFVISSIFQVVCLQRIVPLNKYISTFILSGNTTLSSKLWTLYCVMPWTVHI